MKQDNPFAKLGALDQKLYEDTSSERPTKSTESPVIPENQKSRMLESQNPVKPEIQNAGNPEFQNSSKREFYTKGTYRLCDEALDAIGDAKRILKRQYGVKVNLEEIVETAVIGAHNDLVQNKRQSHLVRKYSGTPEIRNS